jgi:AcrR family transcriptional regulator
MGSMANTKPASRGDQTREALLLAALDVFGHSGFDAASTRAIAQAAGVNQALIGYHFGGKQGLYLGVFEHIVSRMQGRMAPVADAVLRRLEAAPDDPVQRRDLALGLVLELFDAYTDLISEASAAGWVRLVLREQQDPTEAFQLLYDTIFSRLLALLGRLVAMASGLDEADQTCRVRTLMLLGQVLIFFIARGTTARYLQWGPPGPDTIAAIKQQLRLLLAAQFSQGVALS